MRVVTFEFLDTTPGHFRCDVVVEIEGRSGLKYQNMDYSMVKALERYRDDGLRPGSHLYAVLCNDLFACVGKADSAYRLLELKTLCEYIYMELPAPSWGSEQLVEAWIEQGGELTPHKMRKVQAVAKRLQGEVEHSHCSVHGLFVDQFANRKCPHC